MKADWINVKERLPKKLDDYLVVILEDGLDASYSEVATASFNPKGRKWDIPLTLEVWNGYDPPGLGGQVTHWAPLPDLPA